MESRLPCDDSQYRERLAEAARQTFVPTLPDNIPDNVNDLACCDRTGEAAQLLEKGIEQH
ncbi:MAG: tetratricopeptide repeat protein, partial [Moorea sp. SIO2I5]|nr:tetratricopeptide repeat protein [Moorena sp. SIO2I5]